MRTSRVSTLAAAAGLLATLWGYPALPSAPRSVGAEPEEAAPERAATPDPPRRLRMHLHMASWKEDIRRVAPLGLDIAGTDLRAEILDVLGTADDAARLEALGIPVKIVRDLDAEAVTVDARYLDPGEVEALLWGYAAAHPGILDLRLLGATEEGRPTTPPRSPTTPRRRRTSLRCCSTSSSMRGRSWWSRWRSTSSIGC